MSTKGFLNVYGDGNFFVGAADETRDYYGPTAEITHDDTWLNITTDDYEGCAMLNIEALPYLRRALQKIEKQIKDETA